MVFFLHLVQSVDEKLLTISCQCQITAMEQGNKNSMNTLSTLPNSPRGGMQTPQKDELRHLF